MQWPLPDRNYRMPFYLVKDSPVWRAMEIDARLAGVDAGEESAVWKGRPVTYARTLYGTYGGLPAAPDMVLAEAVERGLALAEDWRSAALVVTNLSTEEAIAWGATRRPDAAITLYWTHRLPTPADGDDFVRNGGDRAVHKARGELRRQWNRGRDAGLHLEVVRGPDLRALTPVLAAQAAATSLRHGTAMYGTDVLSAAAAAPGALALVAARGSTPGDIAGAFVCFEHGRTLYLWAAAMDLASRDLHTYGFLMWESIRHAAATGLTTIDAGRGNYRYKRRLGFTHSPLTSLVYATGFGRDTVGPVRAMHEGLQRHAASAWGPHGRTAS
jgi:hypothetical protein